MEKEREELTIKASEILEKFVEANKEEHGFLIIVSDQEGSTIAVEGSAVSLIAGLSHSMIKDDDLGKLIHMAMKFNMHKMIEKIDKMKEILND